MNTRKIFGYGTIAVMLALLVCTLSLTGCPDEPDDDPPLSGDITISPAGPVTTGTMLTANYTGNETVSYQWKNGSTDVGTDSNTYTPTTAGSYTVTVSAAGYTGKTSDAVTVTGLQLPSEITVTNGSTLAEKLQWVADNAHSNTSYTIEVSADEVISGYYLSYTDMSDITITLRGSGSAREISRSGTGRLFIVDRGVTLVLDNNITLKGRSDNTFSLVVVYQGGALIMNSGAKIIDNHGGGVFLDDGAFTMNGGEISGNTARSGGGVRVSGGTFTMNGGVISGNKTGNNADNVYGGGVYVSNSNVGNRGTFTMSGGKISGNTASGSNNGGGGVYVSGTFTTFTMSGGEISGNTAADNGTGGGVWVSGGTFTMSGGEISGNTAGTGGGVYVRISSTNYHGTFTMSGGKISGNTASFGTGGVYVGSNATFTMSDGEISGNTASFDRGGVYVYGGTFTMNGGEISGNTAGTGGGVYVTNSNDGHSGTFRIVTGTVYGSDAAEGLKNRYALSTADGSIAQRGTFSGETWTSKGDLSATNDTIKVVNGELE